MSERLRVLIVDDHQLIAQGVATALDGEGIEARVAIGPTRDDVLEAAREAEPHVVLLDLQIGGEIGSGLDLIRPLSELGASVIVLTGVTDEAALAECLEAGAFGLARKSEPFEQLVAKVIAASRGETVTPAHERFALIDHLRTRRAEDRERFAPFARLTARETEVLAGIIDGKQAEVIARDAFVSVATVRSQIRSVLRKLDVNSQLAAAALAREVGWNPARDSVGV
ncbi:MAG TPA: response regulator transcription factor [Acidimicrobiia bacterium]|nr:response regulator transcription factor [Acidimicrobiia bacterium]